MKNISLSIWYSLLLLLSFNTEAIASDIAINVSAHLYGKTWLFLYQRN
jgi:hypothetical protein